VFKLAKIEPPIQTENSLSGGQITLGLIELGESEFNYLCKIRIRKIKSIRTYNSS